MEEIEKASTEISKMKLAYSGGEVVLAAVVGSLIHPVAAGVFAGAMAYKIAKSYAS